MCNFEILFSAYKMWLLSGQRVAIGQRLPSTIIMWYPKFVLTRDETMGLSTVDGVRANAASWKAPTILPRVIHPKLPPADNIISCECSNGGYSCIIPFALSSEYSCATLLKDWPSC